MVVPQLSLSFAAFPNSLRFDAFAQSVTFPTCPTSKARTSWNVPVVRFNRDSVAKTGKLLPTASYSAAHVPGVVQALSRTGLLSAVFNVSFLNADWKMASLLPPRIRLPVGSGAHLLAVASITTSEWKISARFSGCVCYAHFEVLISMKQVISVCCSIKLQLKPNQTYGSRSANRSRALRLQYNCQICNKGANVEKAKCKQSSLPTAIGNDIFEMMGLGSLSCLYMQGGGTPNMITPTISATAFSREIPCP